MGFSKYNHIYIYVCKYVCFSNVVYMHSKIYQRKLYDLPASSIITYFSQCLLDIEPELLSQFNTYILYIYNVCVCVYVHIYIRIKKLMVRKD